MRIAGKVTNTVLAVVMIALLIMVAACGGSSDDGNTSGNDLIQTVTQGNHGNGEDEVITIGTLTDLTGVSANALQYIDLALMDTVN